jgi:hypothetical protein
MTSGEWTGGLGTSHWNTTVGGVLQPLTIVKDKPDIGYYASDSNITLAWQLSNMQKAGISVIIVSWWGVGNDSGGGLSARLDSAIDNATLNVFRYIESTKNLWNFKVALMVEPFNYANSTYSYPIDWPNLLSYVENTFYRPFNDIVFYWQGKPLLLSFNAQVIPVIPASSIFTTRVEGNNYAMANWVFWEGWNYNDSGTAEINNYERAPNISSDGEVGVIWRYDDYYLSTFGGDAGGRTGFMRFDYTGTQGMYGAEWNYIIQHKSEINFVLIYSWNEYHERSGIEPHWDFSVGANISLVGTTGYYVSQLR